MDSLDLIRAFREVATHESFSVAAKRLGLSKPTVSKYVAELESRFGVRLLNRSTRSVSLTDAGALLLARSTPVLEMIESSQAEVQGRAAQPAGRLRIAALHGMGSGELPALLGQFLGYYPDVHISLHLTDAPVDLAEEGIDVELRFGPVDDVNLIVRKLMPMRMTVCAAPGYWKKHGTPAHPDALARHHALTLSRGGLHPHWRFEDDAGAPLDVAVKSRMDSTSTAPLIQVALQGAGVLYMAAIVVQQHLDSGALVEVLQAHARKDMWLSAVYLQRRHNSAALRALLDFLQTRIAPQDQRLRLRQRAAT